MRVTHDPMEGERRAPSSQRRRLLLLSSRSSLIRSGLLEPILTDRL
jgi:hypothetical protein